MCVRAFSCFSISVLYYLALNVKRYDKKKHYRYTAGHSIKAILSILEYQVIDNLLGETVIED